MSAPRVDAQMGFLQEADKLKSVLRATTLGDGSRHENSAEHSWHLALYALVLSEHAPEGTDLTRVIKMLILHDLIEIDAGDTPLWGDHDKAAVKAAEARAASRIFGLLPEDQAQEFRALWDEFEARESPDARFAKALDRFQPPNQNLASDGVSWRDYNVSYDKVAARVGTPIERDAPNLWRWIAPKIQAWFSKNAG